MPPTEAATTASPFSPIGDIALPFILMCRRVPPTAAAAALPVEEVPPDPSLRIAAWQAYVDIAAMFVTGGTDSLKEPTRK